MRSCLQSIVQPGANNSYSNVRIDTFWHLEAFYNFVLHNSRLEEHVKVVEIHITPKLKPKRHLGSCKSCFGMSFPYFKNWMQIPLEPTFLINGHWETRDCEESDNASITQICYE